MRFLSSFVLLFLVSTSHAQTQTKHDSSGLDLLLRFQEPVAKGSERFHRLTRSETWDPKQTAVIVCDMWDSHHCVNAVRRVAQLAPRIDSFCSALRAKGVTIIHAPSSCVDHYADHPARKRAEAVTPAKKMPKDIASWCDQIPREEAAAYPVDQSAGGEDDDLEDHELWAKQLASIGRNPRSPWKAQVGVIEIDPTQDFISDSGTEIWSVLTENGIDNVILVGVHTNMCVLGRPFGLRRLSEGGKNVVLARDLTDTMYDPRAWPFASHFTGTDLVVSHIERFVCPTISSDQILGDREFRFAKDQRPRLMMIIAEDEYETEETLPAFAAKHLSQQFSVTTVFGNEDERHEIVGLDQIDQMDAVLVSVRRRAISEANMKLLQQFVAQGKPVIGIRTASHAFSLRDKPTPDGKAVWKEFDAEVFGGSYSGHHKNDLNTTIQNPAQSKPHSITDATDVQLIKPGGSLYKTAPLAEGTRGLLWGTVEEEDPQPLAWTYIRADGGRSFYTSLGHRADFEQPEFEAFLAGGICWACGLDPQGLKHVKAQNAKYAGGMGKQR